PKPGRLEQLAIDADMDYTFLKFLRSFTARGREVSDKKSPTYAPAQFAKTPEAKDAKLTSNAFADAMERLFAAGKLRVVTTGSASRQRSHIAEAEGDPSN